MQYKCIHVLFMYVCMYIIYQVRVCVKCMRKCVPIVCLRVNAKVNKMRAQMCAPMRANIR